MEIKVLTFGKVSQETKGFIIGPITDVHGYYTP